MDNFDAKFGAPPPPMYKLRLQHAVGILVTQFVTCILLLAIIQPPFAFESQVAHGKVPMIDLNRIVTISLFTTASTVVLHNTGTSPRDSFTRSCEFLYRMSKSV